MPLGPTCVKEHCGPPQGCSVASCGCNRPETPDKTVWQNPRPLHKPMTNTYCRFSYSRTLSSSHCLSIGWGPSDNTTYNLQRFQTARWVRSPTKSSILGS